MAVDLHHPQSPYAVSQCVLHTGHDAARLHPSSNIGFMSGAGALRPIGWQCIVWYQIQDLIPLPCENLSQL